MRSPCLECPRLKEPKDDCIFGCDAIQEYQQYIDDQNLYRPKFAHILGPMNPDEKGADSLAEKLKIKGEKYVNGLTMNRLCKRFHVAQYRMEQALEVLGWSAKVTKQKWTPPLTEEQIKEIREKYDPTISIGENTKRLPYGYTTVFRYTKDLRRSHNGHDRPPNR